MSETQPGEHPQDPAEGPDFDEQDIESSGDDGTQQQNEPRELNDDDALHPGGNEPAD